MLSLSERKFRGDYCTFYGIEKSSSHSRWSRMCLVSTHPSENKTYMGYPEYKIMPLIIPGQKFWIPVSEKIRRIKVFLSFPVKNRRNYSLVKFQSSPGHRVPRPNYFEKKRSLVSMIFKKEKGAGTFFRLPKGSETKRGQIVSNKPKFNQLILHRT